MTSPLESPRGEATISGRYRVIRKLGSGQLGTVYLASEIATERRIALKVLRADRLDERGLSHFQREFRSIVNLRHPQIASAFDFGYTSRESRPYYTREYIEGAPLPRGPPPAGDQASPSGHLTPILDLLDALEYLHAHEILHLDIHAGNLIVAEDRARGTVLIDFGVAGFLHEAGSATFVQPPSTVAPELLTEQTPGPATDLYAVGRLLLHVLAGDAEDAGRPIREVPGWGSRLTLELERIVGKALQRDPRQRFQTAAEFRDALVGVLGDAPSARRPAEPGEVTVGRRRELDRLESSLRETAQGLARVHWLLGADGMGKTRLLAEARLRAQLRGLGVIEVSFARDGAAEPELYESVRRSGDAGSSRRAPGTTGPEWLEPLSVRHGGSSGERARRAAQAFFAEEGGGSTVLIVDEFERADRESLRLAEALIEECRERARSRRRGRGLAVFIAMAESSRPGWPHPERADTRSRLKALPRRDARDLLALYVRPLTVPNALSTALLAGGGGVPLRLRRIASAVHRAHASSGRVPLDAAAIIESAGDPGEEPLAPAEDRDSRRLLELLAVARWPCGQREIGSLTCLTRVTVARVLERLTETGAVVESRNGRERVYALRHPRAEAAVLEGISPRRLRDHHIRLAEHLERTPSRGKGRRARLARHLLAAGRRSEGRSAALEAASRLRGRGRIDAAVQLLSEASRAEPSATWRLLFAEEISVLREQAGDHAEGVEVLQPALRGELGRLNRAQQVRIRRRLGVHHHRSGDVASAMRLFEDIRKRADPGRDAGELVFVESELAELFTFQGKYREAEEACRRGLDLLERLDARATTRGKLVVTGEETVDAYRRRMGVMLRASLGHLKLRCMDLEAAREELSTASRLASAGGPTTVLAFIVNNLGIVHNQLGDFARAVECYRKSETLLRRLGERNGLINTACNLATIAAKTGDARLARSHLERAEQLLAQQPGSRPEFTVELTRGLVAHSIEDAATAVVAFERALPLGRALGDIQFVGFAELYLAEAYLAQARYRDAMRALRAAARGAGPPVLQRMVASRELVLEAFLGRPRSLACARRRLESIPRTPVALLETWTDLAVAIADRFDPAFDPDGVETRMRECRSEFHRLGVPAGERIARVGLLFRALRKEDSGLVRRELEALRSDRPGHKLLGMLEPLAAAEAYFFLGDLDRCEEALREASSASVGNSFLELDWRVELLHARLAARRGERELARRYLHRSVHTRDLIAGSLPGQLRRSFLAHPRWRTLAKLAERLERRVLPSTPMVSPGLHGIIGASPEMRRVFDLIERIRDHDLPVVIRGETGTGKDVLARAIHESGPRRAGPFLALHCASLPEELFESELFGHEPGAFSGAEAERPGILEHVSGGTLLLDEVAQLSIASQAKLLRVLESSSIRRLGGLDTRAVDVRILASTSEDLEESAAGGRFRSDLYHRLRVAELLIPPLRVRTGDLPLLARHFLETQSRRLEWGVSPRLTSDAIELLEAHDWPGNVRELESLLVRVLVSTSPRDVIGGDAVRPHLARSRPRTLFSGELCRGRTLEELRGQLERVYLTELFHETGGDLRRMMEKLGVKRSSLYRWFARVGIDPRQLRAEER